MEKLADHLWIQSQPLVMPGGVALGTRMAVFKLENGHLLVYSPVKLTESLQTELNSLGEVKYIIAPNPFHHLYVNAYLKAYPEASLYCTAKLIKKRPDLKDAIILRPEQKYPWSSSLQGLLLQSSHLDEYVLYHLESKTLVITDLMMNLPKGTNWKENFALNVLGVNGKPVVSRLVRLILGKHESVKRAIQEILTWDFDRIFLTHGSVIETDGKNIFQNNQYLWRNAVKPRRVHRVACNGFMVE